MYVGDWGIFAAAGKSPSGVTNNVYVHSAGRNYAISHSFSLKNCKTFPVIFYRILTANLSH